jgi:integrase/recombinase XerD
MVHALRHTFATRLAEDGATATEIQALLGHESLNTSQGYIDATANATRQAARANRTYRALERLTVPAGAAGRETTGKSARRSKGESPWAAPLPTPKELAGRPGCAR